MKVVIDIDEEDRKDICNLHFIRESLKFKVGKAIMKGTSFDSVVKDIELDIDKLSRIHADGEFYVKNFDVKRVIDRHINGGDAE